jgi:UDP-N-acetylmuramyl tripeptide synthase
MKTQLAIWAGKIAGTLSRMMGNKGSSIPGVVARKLDNHFLRHLRNSAKIIIYISGTNGKTTTTNLVAHLLESAGKRILSNLEGSNMITGLSAAIVLNAPLFRLAKYDVAVMEVDEASLSKAISECVPDYLIVTNFFRDQLDRYGEVDLLIKKMKDSLRSVDVKLILNADDPFVHRFSDLQKENIYIGLDADACQFQSYSMSESKYCPECQNELSYSVIHYGQLGHYHCTCGFTRPQPTFSAEKVDQGEAGIRLTVEREPYPTNLKGRYNAYNALLAISACRVLGVSTKDIKEGLMAYDDAKGRMQEFTIGDATWKLNLVKNPAGGNVTLSEYLQSEGRKQLIFCLNDHLADGEDISWIWDIDMEIANQKEVEWYIASGKRAYDAALRMKYAGFPEEKILIMPEMKAAINCAKSIGIPAYIMATYTCLSPMVTILTKEASMDKKEGVASGTSVVPFFPEHIKSVRRKRKYHLFKKKVIMKEHSSSSRKNKTS